VHVPDVQVGVPIGTSHAVPQVRQSVSVFSGVSQPFDGSLSQSPKPATHAVMTQLPVRQLVVAFARAQPTLQPPQSVLVISDVSQPVASLPSQSPKLAVHAPIAQVPVAQVAVAFVREQLDPQPPQFTSVVMGVSQPLGSTASQSPKPGRHEVHPHMPVEQSATAWDRRHATPHPVQSVSVPSGVSQPSSGIMLQSAKPGSQLATAHAPLVQVGRAFGSMHALPHAPQFASDVPRSASQPLPAIMSQSSKPMRQTAPHALVLQVAIVPGGVGQVMPQPPQLPTLDVRSTQLPLQSVGVGALQPLTHANAPVVPA
jgi:hypothetical protein